MPPQEHNCKSVCMQTEVMSAHTDEHVQQLSPVTEKWQLVWRNVFFILFFHVGGIYGAYLFFTEAMWLTRFFMIFLYICSGLGITAGAHRLWSHKSYKARLPLRILLMIFNTIAFQDSVFSWTRDHRMHHKYSETDADPYNASRGFFFSHIGWVLIRKHSQIKAKGNTIDMSDILADPVLRFQKKYYIYLAYTLCFIVPTLMGILWIESLWTTFFTCVCLRFMLVSNSTWFVNSAAHMWGNKPYDKHIKPVEIKLLSVFALGEGFHNYHHTFPWDYKTDELGFYGFNVSKLFIDIMYKIGWAYDLKTAPYDIIEKRLQRTGDGSHIRALKNSENNEGSF